MEISVHELPNRFFRLEKNRASLFFLLPKLFMKKKTKFSLQSPTALMTVISLQYKKISLKNYVINFPNKSRKTKTTKEAMTVPNLNK